MDYNGIYDQEEVQKCEEERMLQAGYKKKDSEEPEAKQGMVKVYNGYVTKRRLTKNYRIHTRSKQDQLKKKPW